MDEVKTSTKECILLFNAFPVCVGDKVEIYPRGMRTMVRISGVVKRVSDSALVLETEVNDLVIRLSEIKMVRKLKI